MIAFALFKIEEFKGQSPNFVLGCIDLVTTSKSTTLENINKLWMLLLTHI